MATIKELAEKIYCDLPTDYELTRCRRLKKIGFFHGAELILGKVDCLVGEVEHEHDLEELEDLYVNLCDMIRQLKGE